MPYWSIDTPSKAKLLLVDDQRVNILALYELFRDDCEVFMATNGEQALHLCQTVSPDLVLLDVCMDGIDGLEVCRRLKADPKTVDIPIIFVTGKGEEEDEVAGLKLGAVDFIVKPINPLIVKARVNTHLTLKRQNDILRSLSAIDGLTGLANRRKFDEELNRSWQHSLREETDLSVIMVDVDYFKRYNDRYGHLQGDVCLKRVAGALASATGRPYDVIARFGGEEFVCLLPQTAMKDAVMIAERMLSKVQALQIEHLDSELEQLVTVSLGVATMKANDAVTPQVLLEEADRQLYQAKESGRACVRFGSPLLPPS